MTLTLLDPEPDWPSGRFPTNASALEGGGEVCRGAATDGVTRLLVRAETPGAAKVTFAFANSNFDLRAGSLFGLNSSTPVTSLTVATTALPTGKHVAYSVYEVPKTFPTTYGAEWVLGLRASAEGTGFKSEQTTNVILVRPPLILLHGLNWEGNGGLTWDARPYVSRYEVSQQNRGTLRTIFVPTYGGSLSFDSNRDQVPGYINLALRTVREQGFAARRVDVVGHSMGGLLARRWAGEPGYPGNIYRLVTLDTPHHGSPWAKRLDPVAQYAAQLLGQDFLPALQNLATDRISLPTARVWTHMIAGIDGADPSARSACWSHTHTDATLTFSAWLLNLALEPALKQLFGAEAHDEIVSRSSQLGGDAGDKPYVTLMTGRDGIHMCNTTSLAYANRAIQLLNEDPSGGKFVSVLPGVNEFASPDTSQDSKIVRYVAEGGLLIVAPSAGSIFAPGQSIGVELAVAGLTVQSVAFVTNGDVQIDDNAPFGSTLRAPTQRLGPTEIVALAKLVDGTMVMSAPVPIVVRAETPVSSITVRPNSDLVLRVGDSERIDVSGVLAGTGATVNLDPTDLTITYSVDGIAEIVGSDLVAKRAGEVVITLRQDTARTEIRVVVKDRLPSLRRRPVRR
jgi:pimeloyl-ACP methyl ester carboxylesterase